MDASCKDDQNPLQSVTSLDHTHQIHIHFCMTTENESLTKKAEKILKKEQSR